jgi:predicted nucleic acid-binding protein
MSGVFLDSVGLLALWNASDQWHAAAEKPFAPMNDGRTLFFTTTFILLECGNAAARTPFRTLADQLRVRFDDAGTLIRPTEDDWRKRWRAYRRGEADNAGIVDHISFSVMRRLGLSAAFTNDRHFAAAGFEVLF